MLYSTTVKSQLCLLPLLFLSLKLTRSQIVEDDYEAPSDAELEGGLLSQCIINATEPITLKRNFIHDGILYKCINTTTDPLPISCVADSGQQVPVNQVANSQGFRYFCKIVPGKKTNGVIQRSLIRIKSKLASLTEAGNGPEKTLNISNLGLETTHFGNPAKLRELGIQVTPDPVKENDEVAIETDINQRSFISGGTTTHLPQTGTRRRIKQDRVVTEVSARPPVSGNRPREPKGLTSTPSSVNGRQIGANRGGLRPTAPGARERGRGRGENREEAKGLFRNSRDNSRDYPNYGERQIGDIEEGDLYYEVDGDYLEGIPIEEYDLNSRKVIARETHINENKKGGGNQEVRHLGFGEKAGEKPAVRKPKTRGTAGRPSSVEVRGNEPAISGLRTGPNNQGGFRGPATSKPITGRGSGGLLTCEFGTKTYRVSDVFVEFGVKYLCEPHGRYRVIGCISNIGGVEIPEGQSLFNCGWTRNCTLTGNTAVLVETYEIEKDNCGRVDSPPHSNNLNPGRGNRPNRPGGRNRPNPTGEATTVTTVNRLSQRPGTGPRRPGSGPNGQKIQKAGHQQQTFRRHKQPEFPTGKPDDNVGSAPSRDVIGQGPPSGNFPCKEGSIWTNGITRYRCFEGKHVVIGCISLINSQFIPIETELQLNSKTVGTCRFDSERGNAVYGERVVEPVQHQGGQQSNIFQPVVHKS